MKSARVPNWRNLIVLVDDNPNSCRTLERILRSEGFVVVTFYSGEEFLLSSYRLRPSYLVMDLHLAGMCGLAVQRQLLSLGEELSDHPDDRQR